MFQLIKQHNVLEDGDCRLGKEVVYKWLWSQLKDEDTMREEEDIPTGTKGPGTDQYDSEGSSDVSVGQAAGRDSVRLQSLLLKILLTQRTLAIYMKSHTQHIPHCIYK